MRVGSGGADRTDDAAEVRSGDSHPPVTVPGTPADQGANPWIAHTSLAVSPAMG